MFLKYSLYELKTGKTLVSLYRAQCTLCQACHHQIANGTLRV